MDKKNVLSIVLIALALAALVALGCVIGIKKVQGNAEAEKAALDSLVESVAVSGDSLEAYDLEGTYDFKLESDTLSSSFVATVKKGLDDNYIVTVLSDYTPETQNFSVSGGALHSPTFGEGTLLLQKLTGQLTLQFKKEGSVTTLTKNL